MDTQFLWVSKYSQFQLFWHIDNILLQVGQIGPLIIWSPSFGQIHFEMNRNAFWNFDILMFGIWTFAYILKFALLLFGLLKVKKNWKILKSFLLKVFVELVFIVKLCKTWQEPTQTCLIVTGTLHSSSGRKLLQHQSLLQPLQAPGSQEPQPHLSMLLLTGATTAEKGNVEGRPRFNTQCFNLILKRWFSLYKQIVFNQPDGESSKFKLLLLS